MMSSLVRLRNGSKAAMEEENKLDFLKNVKNANKDAVQKMHSMREEKLIVVYN